MDNNTINMLIKAVITCITVILTTFVIPWIKSKIDADKMVKIEEYCELAVRCAEQIYTPDEWLKKKEYVMDYISRKAHEFGVELTIEDINNMIEGIVNSVKASNRG